MSTTGSTRSGALREVINTHKGQGATIRNERVFVELAEVRRPYEDAHEFVVTIYYDHGKRPALPLRHMTLPLAERTYARAIAGTLFCEHAALAVLDGRGAFEDDHETTYCRCQHCGALLVATLYKTDRPSELRQMSAAEIQRYAPLL